MSYLVAFDSGPGFASFFCNTTDLSLWFRPFRFWVGFVVVVSGSDVAWWCDGFT